MEHRQARIDLILFQTAAGENPDPSLADREGAKPRASSSANGRGRQPRTSLRNRITALAREERPLSQISNSMLRF